MCAAQLTAEADAAQLRSGAEAPREVKTPAASRRLHLAPAEPFVSRGSRRAAVPSARGPRPRSLAGERWVDRIARQKTPLPAISHRLSPTESDIERVVRP